MIEVSNSRQEPAGWIDDYGNFERVAQDWMEEEPGTTWRPVFFEETPPIAAPVALTDVDTAFEQWIAASRNVNLYTNRHIFRAGWDAAHAPLTDDDLRDMAEAACQEALAYGVFIGIFMRLARSVANRAQGISN